MKRIVISILILNLIAICELDCGTEKPFCPRGASWRIDRHFPTPSSATGSWTEMSRHKDAEENLTWGQSACYDPGNSCHLNDWFTWWFDILVPEPPKPELNDEFNSEYIPFIPCGYDPQSGTYLLCRE